VVKLTRLTFASAGSVKIIRQDAKLACRHAFAVAVLLVSLARAWSVVSANDTFAVRVNQDGTGAVATAVSKLVVLAPMTASNQTANSDSVQTATTEKNPGFIEQTSDRSSIVVVICLCRS